MCALTPLFAPCVAGSPPSCSCTAPWPYWPCGCSCGVRLFSVLRVEHGLAPLTLLWGVVGVPLVLAAAALLALRQIPGRAALCAALDRSGGCGGLLMAAEEEPLGGWERAAPAPGRLRVRWQGGRTWTVFLSSLAFVAVALLLPDNLTTPAAHALEIGREADQLAEKVSLLKEERFSSPTVPMRSRKSSINSSRMPLARQPGQDPRRARSH